MLRSTTYFGISMIPQKNRRLLVAGVYFVLALISIFVVGLPWTHFFIPWVLGIVLVYSIVWSDRVFHSVVVPTVYPEPRFIFLKLTHKRRPGDPDERDIAVRNAACYKAYNLMAVYALLASIWLVFSGMNRVPLLLFLPIGVFGPSLPQAVMLWTEADVPEEARA